MTDRPRYTLTELADLAGVTPRTVRYYMAQGLLPAVATSGPGAKYGDAHLARLRVIRRLQRDHQPLAAIRQRLEGLDDASLLVLAEEPAKTPPESALDYIRRVMRRSAQPAPGIPHLASRVSAPVLAPPPAPGPDMPPPRKPVARPSSISPSFARPVEPPVQRAQWERISLAPDIELHVRRPLPRTITKRVDRLIAIARDLFEEDQP